MESNFNLKKFLVENKLTTNSRVLKEQQEQIPNDIIWTDEDEDTASHGTFNQWGQGASELEEYYVELLGFSPSTGKAYTGGAFGSYGETDYDSIDGVKEMNSRESKYYFNSLKKYKPEEYKKLQSVNQEKLDESEDRV